MLSAPFRKQKERYIRRRKEIIKKKGKREEIKGFSVLKSFSRLYQTAEENVKKWRLIKLTEADG